MRKSLLILISMVLIMLCLSCDNDPYRGRRPTDQPNTYWSCLEYDITFQVDNTGDTMGRINNSEGNTAFTFVWSAFDSGVIFATDYEETEHQMEYNALMDGACKFSKEKFEVEILNDYVGIFADGTLPTLTFVRVDDLQE